MAGGVPTAVTGCLPGAGRGPDAGRCGDVVDGGGGEALERNADDARLAPRLESATIGGIIDTVPDEWLRDTRFAGPDAERDAYRRYLSCLVYLPRDRYTTNVRLRIEQELRETFRAESIDYEARMTESALARLFFRIRLPKGADASHVNTEDLAVHRRRDRSALVEMFDIDAFRPVQCHERRAVLADDRGDRSLVGDRRAEVERDRLAQIIHVLDDQRAVEARCLTPLIEFLDRMKFMMRVEATDATAYDSKDAATLDKVLSSVTSNF